MDTVLNLYFSLKLILFLFLFSFIFVFRREKRKYFLLRYLGSLIVGTCILYFMGINNFISNFDVDTRKLIASILGIFYFFYLAISLFFSYKISFYEAILYAICGRALEHIGNCISIIIALLCNVSGVLYRPYSVTYFLINLATYLVIFFGLGFYFFKVGTPNKVNLEKKKLFWPALLLILAVSILNSYAPAYGTDNEVIISFKVYAIVCCLSILFLSLELFESGDYRYELKTIRELNDRRKEQYEFSKETIDVINTKCHDLKKMLASKNGLLIEEKDIKEMQNKLSIYDSIINTGNQYLDLVLTDKSLFCERNNIKLSVIADGRRLSFLSELDIYSLFGNILDNAVEAVMKLDEKERVISILIKDKGIFLIIHSDNCFLNAPTYKNGQIETSKKDKKEHGYGILSIKNVVEKYDGGMKINTEGNVFSIDIIIPIKDKNDTEKLENNN